MWGIEPPPSSKFLELDGARLDLAQPGVGDPLYVPAAQFAFEHTLGVADPVEAEMADIWLGRQERHRNLVAQLAPLELGVEDHGEFVSRPEARGALRRADDDRARLGAEPLESFRRLPGMVDPAYRNRVRFGPESFDLVERQVRPRGNH